MTLASVSACDEPVVPPLSGKPGVAVPTKVDKYEIALLAAAHHFAESGEVDHLRAFLDKHRDLVKERIKFAGNRKPSYGDQFTLLHRAADRTKAGGAIWDTLLDLRRKGLVGRLGVSVQNRAEFDGAAVDPDVEIIQMPFNLLDRRWEELAPARANLAVHARSVFLQGLLTGVPAARWPVAAGFDAAGLVEKLQQLALALGRKDVADLAVAFVRSQPWIESMVIGVETEAQLSENLERFTTSPLSAAEVEVVRRDLPRLPAQLVDPAQWTFQ